MAQDQTREPLPGHQINQGLYAAETNQTRIPLKFDRLINGEVNLLVVLSAYRTIHQGQEAKCFVNRLIRPYPQECESRDEEKDHWEKGRVLQRLKGRTETRKVMLQIDAY